MSRFRLFRWRNAARSVVVGGGGPLQFYCCWEWLSSIFVGEFCRRCEWQPVFGRGTDTMWLSALVLLLSLLRYLSLSFRGGTMPCSCLRGTVTAISSLLTLHGA